MARAASPVLSCFANASLEFGAELPGGPSAEEALPQEPMLPDSDRTELDIAMDKLDTGSRFTPRGAAVPNSRASGGFEPMARLRATNLRPGAGSPRVSGSQAPGQKPDADKQDFETMSTDALMETIKRLDGVIPKAGNENPEKVKNLMSKRDRCALALERKRAKQSPQSEWVSRAVCNQKEYLAHGSSASGAEAGAQGAPFGGSPQRALVLGYTRDFSVLKETPAGQRPAIPPASFYSPSKPCGFCGQRRACEQQRPGAVFVCGECAAKQQDREERRQDTRRQSLRLSSRRSSGKRESETPVEILDDTTDEEAEAAEPAPSVEPAKRRTSLRLSERTQPLWKQLQGLKATFPQGGGRDSVVVFAEDLSRLDPEEFLNDNVIDFYMKTLWKGLDPAVAARCHFFNSYFYKKLTEKSDSPGASGAELHAQRHERVKRWTKSTDIFSKDFLFIPIHDAFHWSLVIVCHPGARDGDACRRFMIHLDSMPGSHATNQISNALRAYLQAEWQEKAQAGAGTVPGRHAAESGDPAAAVAARSFRAAACPNRRPQLPQQQNHADCGLFLLAYLHYFLHSVPVIQNDAPDIASLQRSTYPEFLTSRWFHEANASLLRDHLQHMVLKLLREQAKLAEDDPRIQLLDERIAAYELTSSRFVPPEDDLRLREERRRRSKALEQAPCPDGGGAASGAARGENPQALSSGGPAEDGGAAHSISIWSSPGETMEAESTAPEGSGPAFPRAAYEDVGAGQTEEGAWEGTGDAPSFTALAEDRESGPPLREAARGDEERGVGDSASQSAIVRKAELVLSESDLVHRSGPIVEELCASDRPKEMLKSGDAVGGASEGNRSAGGPCSHAESPQTTECISSGLASPTQPVDSARKEPSAWEPTDREFGCSSPPLRREEGLRQLPRSLALRGLDSSGIGIPPTSPKADELLGPAAAPAGEPAATNPRGPQDDGAVVTPWLPSQTRPACALESFGQGGQALQGGQSPPPAAAQDAPQGPGKERGAGEEGRAPSLVAGRNSPYKLYVPRMAAPAAAEELSCEPPARERRRVRQFQAQRPPPPNEAEVIEIQ
uniref:Sentrin-specific protease 7 n=1 Tax=Tetraselmis sp. GSL018 TaxID=582737 RepID=A0A061R5Y6_9CHLO|mmetsp:Transcript_31829/g.75564  ORF Transcript_31829/g.75564 Transcript_31829/m.75564 type:complete len:1068 (-) Transcript_31829:86-3289(-)|eukprot:CAMPEP_0177602394 /NCGR_PEP_ID=MMETSP0419_2-20121207/14836_1 /TAXON_ID=582737 /ORGANISM="Tetraselmis sp., Strain GSL018" /LENGTH=1067 /DNA_ID=CAMNT_0019095857 /DNA_START=123 /DNA_END=3326 /DNA_ORIENTATION=+